MIKPEEPPGSLALPRAKEPFRTSGSPATLPVPLGRYKGLTPSISGRWASDFRLEPDP